ncbi:DUF5597 domain-containing protein [bacterium]|nr:DUF5597 domain-containing protein [bacterium]
MRKQGTAMQLMVDGKPFLMIAGELGNSTASSIEAMQPVWPKLVQLNLNTFLAPVYWELLEPEENQFDFSLVDGLIEEARKHDLHLVLLWFGSWKNSMSCYAPYWVKTNQERFPRAENAAGASQEILSCFSEENRKADQKAFAALMRHIKEADGREHTVIMMQVENEIGMIPDARDHSSLADRYFEQRVPQTLMDYLKQKQDALIPEFKEAWENAGAKMSGTWIEIFGQGLGTDEIFMAWYYARYVEAVASAGKTEYALPMYVNAALIRPGYQPGQYPSAGPLPHLMDIWRAGAPSIDFLSPDIYFPNFAEWCQKYHRAGNPLFIPEVGRGNASAVNIYYALGQHDAMGYSPFSIESTDDPLDDPIGKSYRLVSQIAPLVLEKQGKNRMRGVLLDEATSEKRVMLGDYTFVCSHEYTSKWTYRAPGNEWPRKGCLIIQVGENDYFIAGSGVIITFEPADKDAFIAGIASLDEGEFINGTWTPGRRMNGDQSHQGRHMRLSHWEYSIQKIRLYRYQ